MTTKIIIDTDPGIDDTMAILFALRSKELEVVGLTAVFGNTDIDHAAQNCLRLVELEGHGHIPCSKGSGCPLVIPTPKLGTHVHGTDGMGNTNPKPPSGKLLDIPAAQFIVETILAHPGEITLVPVGPLTNIALALRLEPKIIRMVKEVVIMGGAATIGGNISPVAEANIYHDPHAAAIVFNAGWQLTMVGLDVTTRVIMTRNYLNKLTHAGNPVTDFIGTILPCYQDYFSRTFEMDGNIHTHDPSAIAYLLDRNLFKTRSLPIFVETEGHCMGQTVLDPKAEWGNQALVNVCVEVDSARLLSIFEERLTK